MIIQGVSNLSLIGNRTNEVINTVINCTSPAGIAVVGSSNIVIANIVMNECGNNFDSFTKNIFENQVKDVITLFVLDSKSITIMYFYSLWHQKLCGFELVNALESKLSNLVSSYLLIWHIRSNDSMVNTTDTLFIENFQTYSEIDNIYTIKIEWHKINFNFKATILNVNFTNKLALHITCFQCLGNNTITISNCDFNDMVGRHSLTMNDVNYYQYPLYYHDDIYKCYDHFCDAKIVILLYSGQLENHASEKKVCFSKCNFINNARSRKLLLLNMENSYNTKMPLITLNNCMFYSNKNTQLLLVRCQNGDSEKHCASIFVKNTTVLSNIQEKEDIIYIYHVILALENVKIINNSFTVNGYMNKNIIHGVISYLKCKGYNEFSMNSAQITIMGLSIHMCENSILNFSSNTLDYNVEIFSPQNDDEIDTCAVQYISERGNLDKEFQIGENLNYSIIHNNNKCVISNTYSLYHCEWDSTSAFWTSSSLYVNQRFIQQKISVSKLKNDICLCNENKTQDCYIEELGSHYPGVTVLFNFIVFSTSTEIALLQQNDDSYFACRGKNSAVVDSGKCKRLTIILKHESGTWCELYLTASPILSYGIIQRAIYTITFLPCPRGFSLHLEGYCQCDQTLLSHIPSLTHCNIDDQTIPRPANSWISAHTVNNSQHSYLVSLHCPFDYCLPHSSHLNLSTPDSQCQFNRSGVLCGQCQQGLSAVFGSSQCKQCSSIYLLIIIPIGIAGLALVLLLFILNLTVTNGDINAFLLYVNIIDINSSIFFPINGPGMAMHTFISLANLDLGITTCFYNGMDEYAKMWLQLVFPAYLILIAATIIMASRYSIRIQRLTARRALPVLATLFLLSYTKVLLVVSKTLFLYSTIVHLPSNHTALVWSVDANVSLLEIKFIILFIACAILFIILIPFNVLLIFARQLSRFKRINYFKPLLDAYQGPYKIRFYFWSG